VHRADDGRAGGRHQVPAALHERGHAPAVGLVAGPAHHEGEDDHETAALRGAGDRTPQRPQLRSEQQAQRQRGPRGGHDQHHRAWPGADAQQHGHAERADPADPADDPTGHDPAASDDRVWWRRPVVWGLTTGFAGQAFAYYGVTAWLPLLLRGELGIAPGAAGVSSSIFQIAAIVGPSACRC